MRSSPRQILAVVAVLGVVALALWFVQSGRTSNVNLDDAGPSIVEDDEGVQVEDDRASSVTAEGTRVSEGHTTKVSRRLERGTLVLSLVTTAGRHIDGATVHVGKLDPIETRARETRIELPAGRYPVFIDLPIAMRSRYCLEPVETNVVEIASREVSYVRRVLVKGTVEFLFDTTIRARAGCTLIFRSAEGGTPWREGIAGPATRYRTTLPPGTWRVRTLFGKESKRVAKEIVEIEVKPGSAQQVKIESEPMTAWFRGVVVDEDGAPVVGLPMRVEWYPKDGLRFSAQLRKARTDERGKFALQGPSAEAQLRIESRHPRALAFALPSKAYVVRPNEPKHITLRRGFAIEARVPSTQLEPWLAIRVVPRGEAPSERRYMTRNQSFVMVGRRAVARVNGLPKGEVEVEVLGGVRRKAIATRTVRLGEKDAPRVVRLDFDLSKSGASKDAKQSAKDQERGRR